MRARHLVLEHLAASRLLLQNGELHGRILVPGADAGAAVFHEPIFGLTYKIRKALFSLVKNSSNNLPVVGRWRSHRSMIGKVSQPRPV
jgi:hypothetical protein